MRGRGWMLVGLAAAFLLGGVAGGIVGFRLGTDAIVSHWVRTNANHTEEMVGILERLRADRDAEALDALEVHLNRHVFGLMPASREGASIRNGARERAGVAARRARVYREAHPYAGRTALDRDVGRFLGGG